MPALPEWAKPIRQQDQAPAPVLPEWAKPIEPTSQAINTIQPEQPASEKGFLGGVAGDISRRYEKTKEMVGRRTEDGIASGIFNAPGTVGLAAGQVAGAGVDITGRAIKEAYIDFTPKQIQEAVSAGVENILGTDIGKTGLALLKEGRTRYKSFAKKYPDAAMAIEGALNMWALSGVGSVKKSVSKETGAMTTDILALRNALNPKRLDIKLSKTVRHGINKSIRPTVVGKRTYRQAEKYYSNATRAVEEIINQKDKIKLFDESGSVVTGKLPKSLDDFSRAIDETKRIVFSEYDDLAKLTGSDSTVDLIPIAKELKKVAKSKTLNDLSPEISSYASSLADSLLKRGKYTAGEAQDAIAALNGKLESFYKNPNYSAAAKANVDAVVINNLRKQLNHTITKATGKEYSALKKKYGALKSIERDVNRRAIVEGRKDLKGLVDFSDIFTGGQAIRGIISHEPAVFSAAATSAGIAKYYKMLKDPNRAVEKMFIDAEKIDGIRKVISDIKPNSILGKGAMGVKEDIELLRRAKKSSKNPLP